MSRLALAACLACSAVLPISAQDPTKTLPEWYRVQLDNEYVRVVRAYYPAGAKLPEHTHPGGTTVYVYLNDSEGVVFRHSGRSNRAVTRPAVKAGAVRVASGPDEHHTAENPASTHSEFLRIWLKTDAASERTMRRIPAGDYPPDQDVMDEVFENSQLRITRMIRGSITFKAPATTPALVVSRSGSVEWIPAGESRSVYVSHGRIEFLQIDLLTPPK